MAMTKNSLVHVSFRLDATLRKQIQGLADGESRTFSNYIKLLLANHVEEVQKPKAKRNGMHASEKVAAVGG